MKNCPFCAEEIQDEAVKCKHCGEWLNKKSPSDYLNVAKTFIGQKINDYQEYQTKHLFIPETNKPIELKNTKFYPEYFTYKDKKFTYDQIYGISHKNSAQYINGISTEKTFSCLLFVKSELFTNDKGTIDIGVSSELISFNKKKREQAIVCCNWIEKKTIKNRLKLYAEELSEKGYFIYKDEIKIYNNGTLYIKDTLIINLVDAYKKNLIWYGLQYKALLGADRGQDPYTFRINKTEKNTSFFGFGKIAEFDVSYNKDVFDYLLNTLFDKGTII